MTSTGYQGAGEAPGDEAVLSGRQPSLAAGGVVLGMAMVTGGALASMLLGWLWPVLAAAALVTLCVAPVAAATWRYRKGHAALRKARRRVAGQHQAVTELGGMFATSPASLRALVHTRCEAADSEGQALLIEVDDGDQMEQAWREEGFEPVEHAETRRGGVTLLLRPPK